MTSVHIYENQSDNENTVNYIDILQMQGNYSIFTTQIVNKNKFNDRAIYNHFAMHLGQVFNKLSNNPYIHKKLQHALQA